MRPQITKITAIFGEKRSTERMLARLFRARSITTCSRRFTANPPVIIGRQQECLDVSPDCEKAAYSTPSKRALQEVRSTELCR